MLNRKALTTERVQAAQRDGAVRSSRQGMDMSQMSELFMVHGEDLAAASRDQISSSYELSTLVSTTRSTDSTGNTAPCTQHHILKRFAGVETLELFVTHIPPNVEAASAFVPRSIGKLWFKFNYLFLNKFVVIYHQAFHKIPKHCGPQCMDNFQTA